MGRGAAAAAGACGTVHANEGDNIPQIMNMKHWISLAALAAFSCPGMAQDAVPPVVVVEDQFVEAVPAREPAVRGEVVGEEVVVEEVIHGVPAAGAFDPVFTRRHLAVEPREVPPAVPGLDPPPGSVVETIEETTVERIPGLPPRVYHSERHVVVVEGRELPYVTVPVLFKVETAELLDSESRVALEETAAAIREVIEKDPEARFDIEGHTSTDGPEDFNLKLSADRARRVHEELTQRYEIPAEVLTAHGYGENFPNFPDGTPEERVLDRRVLVVRMR
jgi:outer membrane protein OmpA-like peptidoglycan-associated protein